MQELSKNPGLITHNGLANRPNKQLLSKQDEQYSGLFILVLGENKFIFAFFTLVKTKLIGLRSFTLFFAQEKKKNDQIQCNLQCSKQEF